MSTDRDSSPAGDERRDENVGEALADYLALVEDTVRTYVTDDEVKTRIRRAMARAASDQGRQSGQVQDRQGVPDSEDRWSGIEAAERHTPSRDEDQLVDPVSAEFGDENPGAIDIPRDRRKLLSELLQLRRRGLGPVVLAGPGGAGKTTLAINLARSARAQGDRVWWISAIDPVSLSQGLMAVARQLGGAHEAEAVGRGTAEAIDRFWRLLEKAEPGWLLIFDEADDPRVLAAGLSTTGIQDRTGWLRSSERGLALATSRQTDAREWPGAQLVTIGQLQEEEAARALLELAPSAGDRAEARALARRLSSHPLNLRLAGGFLRSPAALGTGFTAFEKVLARSETAKSSPLRHRGQGSSTLTARMVNLSLDSLRQQGFPQARPVLQVASCYAATTIPAELLDADSLTGLFGHPGQTSPGAPQRVLRELERINLLERTKDGLALHTVVAEVSRAGMVGHDPSSVRTRHAAIDLMAARVGGLSLDEPEAWPEYRRLGPHLLSLLDTTAQRADRAHLGLLMETAARVIGAFDHDRTSQAAIILGERALARCDTLGNEHRAVLRIRHFMAWAVADLGDLDKAEALYQDVYQIRQRAFGSDDEDTLNSRHELAWIAGCRRDWATAEAGYRDTLQASVRALGFDHPKTMTTRHELAWAIANGDHGRLGEAREMLEGVLADRRRVLGAEHLRTLTTQHELAWITARQGDWATAERAYRQLLDSRMRMLGDDHPDTLVGHHELAWVAARQGRTAEAESRYTSVLNQCRRLLGDDHPQTKAARVALHELRCGRIVDAQHLA